ncbi:MAG: hypothetical protein ACYC2U_05525 [Candidatus Amoebophilus sp.]
MTRLIVFDISEGITVTVAIPLIFLSWRGRVAAVAIQHKSR